MKFIRLSHKGFFHTSFSDEELEKKQVDSKPQAEDDLNAQLNPDSEDDSELEEDSLSKGGLLLKDMLKQNDDSSDDEDDEEIDEDQTKSAVLLQGMSLCRYVDTSYSLRGMLDQPECNAHISYVEK